MIHFFNIITSFLNNLTQSYCIFFNKKTIDNKYTEIIVDDLYYDNDLTFTNTNTNTNTNTECTIEPPQLSWAIDDV